MRAVNHFARAKLMFAAIAAALALPPEMRREELGAIGPYKSRGKGRGTPSRRFGNKSGRYEPHQGAQERLRRLVGGWAATQARGGPPKRQAIAQARAIGAGETRRKAA